MDVGIEQGLRYSKPLIAYSEARTCGVNIQWMPEIYTSYLYLGCFSPKFWYSLEQTLCEQLTGKPRAAAKFFPSTYMHAWHANTLAKMHKFPGKFPRKSYLD